MQRAEPWQPSAAAYSRPRPPPRPESPAVTPASTPCRPARMQAMASRTRTAVLVCLTAAAAAVPAPNLYGNLSTSTCTSTFPCYVCQDQQCVLGASGLPKSECEAACAPRPNANYTCQSGQCVVSARGLPKAMCVQVCGGPAPAPGRNQTIVDLAVANLDLSTLVTALKAGGLVGTLSGSGPFTVFAPTNEAFAALPPATLKRLLDPANIKELQALLEYHVASGSVYSKDLTNQERIKTLEGESVEITLLNAAVFVDRSRVVEADNSASNGYVPASQFVAAPLLPVSVADSAAHG